MVGHSEIFNIYVLQWLTRFISGIDFKSVTDIRQRNCGKLYYVGSARTSQSPPCVRPRPWPRRRGSVKAVFRRHLLQWMSGRRARPRAGQPQSEGANSQAKACFLHFSIHSCWLKANPHLILILGYFKRCLNISFRFDGIMKPQNNSYFPQHVT